jgi:hypothetical protein
MIGMDATQRLATWVTPEKKAVFQALARQEGLSDSALLGLLVDRVLSRNHPTPNPQDRAEAELRSGRLTVRLRATDGARLRGRAKARGMEEATYLALLVRAHLCANPPLPKAELHTLIRAVAEVSAIGRNLNQIALAANQEQQAAQSFASELRALLRALGELRDEVKDVVKANLVSWEAASAEANG